MSTRFAAGNVVLGCMKCNPALPARHRGSKRKRRGITHLKGGASAPSCSEAKDGDTSCAREGRSPLARAFQERNGPDDNERVCRVCFQISHTLLPFALFSGLLGDQVHAGIRFFTRWCCHLPHGLNDHKKERSHRHPASSTKLALITIGSKTVPLTLPYCCSRRKDRNVSEWSTVDAGERSASSLPQPPRVFSSCVRGGRPV
jgi:hypothetical protein